MPARKEPSMADEAGKKIFGARSPKKQHFSFPISLPGSLAKRCGRDAQHRDRLSVLQT